MSVILPCSLCGFYHITWDAQARCTQEHYRKLNDEIRQKRAEGKATWQP